MIKRVFGTITVTVKKMNNQKYIVVTDKPFMAFAKLRKTGDVFEANPKLQEVKDMRHFGLIQVYEND